MFPFSSSPDFSDLSSPSAQGGNIGFWQGIGNSFTGNVDWQRQQKLLQQQQSYNSAQAQLNRDFQERMANSAYQRGAKDLQAAGYNPALVTNGAQASTPSGSSANASLGSSGHVDGFGQIMNVVNSALKVAQMAMK